QAAAIAGMNETRGPLPFARAFADRARALTDRARVLTDRSRVLADRSRVLADRLGAGEWLRFLRSKPLSTKKKRSDLVYGAEEIPPPMITLFVGMQHVSLIRIQLIYPLFVIQMAGLPTASSVNMLSLAMLALGLAAIMQSFPKGPVGSSLLLPSC